ncbi:TOM1-like protein 1 [Glycine soja]|uniref:TOM1-like protein 1 n=1 Tax=Glycine soja TaxID=3848 RepID=A0A445HZU0_GLYSO|nr:TOM1-like protein 1 [Glycine soja]
MIPCFGVLIYGGSDERWHEFKVKEFYQQEDSRHADKLVGEATSEALHEPEWAGILHICDFINADQLNTAELVRVIKKRVVAKSPPRVQYLAFVLLESLVKNCDKAFLEAWGESTIELRYLPVYAETYKSLKSRGIGFPSRDNESLAPVFTPRSATASADHDDIHVQSFTSEQIKETFDVARNSIELLSVFFNAAGCVKESSIPDVHRIVETGIMKQCFSRP